MSASVPACCSEYGKARGSKGFASYFMCDRATHVGRCTFTFACWLLHVACESGGGADLTALRGMPSNSRRYSRLFAVTAPRFGFSGTVLVDLIRAQP